MMLEKSYQTVPHTNNIEEFKHGETNTGNHDFEGDMSEDEEERIQNSSSANNYSTHQLSNLHVITDEEANDIYLRMAA